VKTDTLIAMLSKQVPAIDRKPLAFRIALVMLFALAIASVFMVWWMQLNPRLMWLLDNVWFWVRFTFIVSTMVLCWHLFLRLGKPGHARRVSLWVVLIPFVLLAALGSSILWQAPSELRRAMMLGVSWDVCSRNIAMISIPLFIASIWIARQFAPVRLRVTGAILGFMSGAAAALIYSLHCPELSPAFLTVWYTLGMLIPAVVGALLGKRLLSW
jgi:hypothetical protein